MRVALTGLTAGELSPEMVGRADVQRYHMAARIIENFHVHPNGLLEFREGWILLGGPKRNDVTARLWPFVFSDEQTYMLEFGDLYMRVWKDGGQVLSAGSPVEIATPWTVGLLPQLNFTQSADVLWVFTGNDTTKPKKITRTSHTSWTLADWNPKDGPYLGENIYDARGISLDAGAGNARATVENIVGLPAPFVPSDVGRMLRILDRYEEDGIKKVQWNWGYIVTYWDPYSVQTTIEERAYHVPLPTKEKSWRLGEFSDTTGWPICGTLHEQRLWIAGGKLIPDRADSSVIGDYERFGPGPNAADGVGIGAAAPRVNRIRNLVPLNDIMAMTFGTEVRMGAGTDRAAITPDNVSAKPMSNFGSARGIAPITAGNGVLFVDRNRRRIMEYAFDESLSAYKANDLTLLADHMAGRIEDGGFSGLAWQQQPIGMVWAPRADGQIPTATYSSSEQVLAWVRHIPGHPDFAAGHHAICESIATLPGNTSQTPGASPGDEVWAIFARFINGAWRRTVERCRFTRPTDLYPEQRVHLDCALTFDNSINATLTFSVNVVGATYATCSAPIFSAGDVGRFITQHWAYDTDEEDRLLMTWGVAQITGVTDASTVNVDIRSLFQSAVLPALGWRLSVSQLTGLPAQLQNVSLMVVGDGRVDGVATSVGGTLVLPRPAGLVHVGYQYGGRLRTLPFDAGPVPAVLQGRPTRIDRITLRVLNSVGGKVSTDKKRWEPILGYDIGEMPPLGSPPARHGDWHLLPAGDWTGWPAFWLVQDQPMPLNVALQIPNIYSPSVQP